MTMVEKIIDSIQAVHGEDFPVYYHDDPTLNLMTQTMQFPCALLLLLSTGRAANVAGVIREQVSAAVFFVERQEGIDFDAIRNEQTIDRCKTRALAWLSSLPSSDLVELVAEAQTRRVYDRYDDILTGYGVQADLIEVEGFTGCPSVDGDFNNDFNGDFLVA